MSRSGFVAVGLFLVLGACGSKFASESTGSAGGAGGAGEATAGSGEAGDSPEGGRPSGGAGESSSGSSGRAGAGSGGTSGSVGVGGLLGGAGLAGGPVSGTDIPRVGLAVWLRADQGVLQENGAVASWLDQSGNKRHATMSPGDSRPTFDARGFNDRPTIVFDGVNDYLELDAGFSSFKTGLSAFVVTRPVKAPESCWSLLEFSNGSEVDDISIGAWMRKWLYEVEIPFQHQGEVKDELPVVVSVLHRAAGTADVRVNGALQGSSTFALPKEVQRTSNFVGRTLYKDCELYAGAISEIILYSRAVTPAELRTIEQYLTEHWALTP